MQIFSLVSGLGHFQFWICSNGCYGFFSTGSHILSGRIFTCHSNCIINRAGSILPSRIHISLRHFVGVSYFLFVTRGKHKGLPVLSWFFVIYFEVADFAGRKTECICHAIYIDRNITFILYCDRIGNIIVDCCIGGLACGLGHFQFWICNNGCYGFFITGSHFNSGRIFTGHSNCIGY